MSPGSHRVSARGPFHPDRGGDLTLLRRVLEGAGYTESSLSETAPLNTTTGMLNDIPVVLRRTAESSSYNSLVRLFLVGCSVPEKRARAALAPMELEALISVGLLKRGEEGIQAQAALLPFAGLLLARDFSREFTRRPNPRNYVPGVGIASHVVANLTVRRQVEKALDLGTGLGVQAILAAHHADHVIATDINPRALNFTELNARLNGLANIEIRRGSLYEPVADGRFDLIVSNPPFVISPRLRHRYRDGGMTGDLISERVIRGAPGLLREGGFCTVLFNWHHRTEDDWPERPAEWLDSSGCDGWLICSDTQDPLAYASGWLSYWHGHNQKAYSRLLDEWLSYIHGLGIGFISLGTVILRRRSGGHNWFRAERAPDGPPNGSCSAQIQRVFAARDFLSGLSEEKDLLGRAFLLTSDHQLDQVLHVENGQWIVTSARLKQLRGYQFPGYIDRLVSMILAGCDGRRTVAELVTDLAAGLQMKADDIIPGCTAVIRKLLETGFLTPSLGHPEPVQ